MAVLGQGYNGEYEGRPDSFNQISWKDIIIFLQVNSQQLSKTSPFCNIIKVVWQVAIEYLVEVQ